MKKTKYSFSSLFIHSYHAQSERHKEEIEQSEREHEMKRVWICDKESQLSSRWRCMIQLNFFFEVYIQICSYTNPNLTP